MKTRGLAILVAGLVATTGVAQAASRTIKIKGNHRYAGNTNRNLDFRPRYWKSGSISLHLSARKQIDGFALSWRCKGQRFARRTNVTILEGLDAPIPMKNRAFSFRRVVPWVPDYDWEKKVHRTGTATVRVRGRFFKRTPHPQSLTIAAGTLTVVEGNCRLPMKWEFYGPDTFRMPVSEYATGS